MFITGVLTAFGGIRDSNGNIEIWKGSSSTGIGMGWINTSEANVASASNVGTNMFNKRYSLSCICQFDFGNNPVPSYTALNYNPSTDTLTAAILSVILVEQQVDF